MDAERLALPAGSAGEIAVRGNAANRIAQHAPVA
jgi:hypothetical protein